MNKTIMQVIIIILSFYANYSISQNVKSKKKWIPWYVFYFSLIIYEKYTDQSILAFASVINVFLTTNNLFFKKHMKVKCKDCKKPFETRTGQTRCKVCLLVKKERRKEKKKLTKKWIAKETKRLHKKAWENMSMYIRVQHADMAGYVKCYTCDAIRHWKTVQGGHYWHRTLDFDERNIHPQCPRCNMRESRGGLGGNLNVYATKLLRDHGEEWMMDLAKDAQIARKYTIEELENIIKDLKQKIIILNDYKNLI